MYSLGSLGANRICGRKYPQAVTSTQSHPDGRIGKYTGCQKTSWKTSAPGHAVPTKDGLANSGHRTLNPHEDSSAKSSDESSMSGKMLSVRGASVAADRQAAPLGESSKMWSDDSCRLHRGSGAPGS